MTLTWARDPQQSRDFTSQPVLPFGLALNPLSGESECLASRLVVRRPVRILGHIVEKGLPLQQIQVSPCDLGRVKYRGLQSIHLDVDPLLVRCCITPSGKFKLFIEVSLQVYELGLCRAILRLERGHDAHQRMLYSYISDINTSSIESRKSSSMNTDLDAVAIGRSAYRDRSKQRGICRAPS